MLKDFIDKETLTKEETNYVVECYKNGDKLAGEILIEKNKGLVYHAIKKHFYFNKNDIDDMLQVGCIGILRAVKNYDSTKSAFSYYAYFYINAEIMSFVSNTIINKKSSLYRSKMSKIKKVFSNLLELNNCDPSLEQIATHLNWSIEEVSYWLNIEKEVISINRFINDDQDTLEKHIASVDNSYDEVLNKVLLEELISKANLTLRERRILELRWGLNGGETMKFRDIGKLSSFNVSGARIDQIEKEAIKKLQEIVLNLEIDNSDEYHLSK